MRLTPNVKRLVIVRMSNIAVPKGGGLADALAALATPGRLAEIAKRATAEVEKCLLVARKARPDLDDESLAGLILAGIEAKTQRAHTPPGQADRTTGG